MSKRISTSIGEGIYDLLQEWANEERRSISGLSAFILEQAVREHQKQMQKQSPPSDEKQDKSWEQFVRSIFYFLPPRRYLLVASSS